MKEFLIGISVAVIIGIIGYYLIIGMPVEDIEEEIMEEEVIEEEIMPVEDIEETFDIWQPIPGTTWNWQLDTPVSEIIQVDMYDIDLFDNDKSIVDSLHDKGIKAVCYISVGSWEEWRPDAPNFPSHVLGNDYEDWYFN